MGILSKTIVVPDPDHGQPTVYLAGEEVPDEIIDAIETPVKGLFDVDEDFMESDDESDDESDVPEPPRSGKGSGVEAWREYAETIGLNVPEGATKAEIIAAVDAG